jgi:hypothetical protein
MTLKLSVGHMSEEFGVKVCIAEISRFFKYYHKFCKSPDSDLLREVLSYSYSVNEKLRKYKMTNLFSSPHYLALQALRNYSVHESELFNMPKALPINHFEKLNSELSILCLMPINVIDDVLSGKLREETQKAIKETFVFYNKYVDIYPCIFNFGVTLYFEVKKLGFDFESPYFEEIEASINYEKEHNFNHYVNGRIATLKGDSIDDIFETNLVSLSEYVAFQESLPKDEYGLRRGITKIEFTPEKWFYSKSSEECIQILDELISDKKIIETTKEGVRYFEPVYNGLSIYEQFLISQFNRFFKETYGHE